MSRGLRTPPSTKSPTRAAISGISLLMVVAFAVQAGAMSPAVQARQYSGLPTVRMIAQAVTRRVERQVRRQQERPAVCRVAAVGGRRVEVETVVGRAASVALPRRLLVLLTNLPPPADARA